MKALKGKTDFSALKLMNLAYICGLIALGITFGQFGRWPRVEQVLCTAESPTALAGMPKTDFTEDEEY
ncbi:hypothetical protein [Flavobacterium sp. XGLA_31]|uniref:hypothetical protein n=1 Tax=Flavobacterium sp. XGLA_31 TaxID=3447666 RepID=UPI003F2FC861